MENDMMPEYWLKIIRDENPNQVESLLKDHESGLSWGTKAKTRGRNNALYSNYDNYGRIRKGDKMVFYVLKSNKILYSATVSKTEWKPKSEKREYMQKHKGLKSEEWKWCHMFYFEDIKEIPNPIDLSTGLHRIPILSVFEGHGGHGLAMKDCSMWKIFKEDYDAIVGE